MNRLYPRSVALTSWALALVVLTACEATPPATPATPTPPLPAVTALTIDGLPNVFAIGQSVQLKVSATLPDGTRLDATGQVTWQSSDEKVMTVSAAGLLTVTGPGEADLTATLRSVRGTAHLTVPKPGYAITGVVHESAPTHGVLLAGATVGIHFAGCPTCPHDNQETTTDSTGHFTLPGIDSAGFSLVVSKSGYDTANFYVAQLPRDQHPDVSLAPSFAIVRQVFEGTIPPCRTDSFPLFRWCSVDHFLGVYHDGEFTIEELSPPRTSGDPGGWAIEIFQGDRYMDLLCGFYTPCRGPLRIQGGFVYRLRMSAGLMYDPKYRIVVSRPN